MRSLPERPDLRQLKIQAKDLVKAVEAADSAALARVRDYFLPPVGLLQAQLVIAREYNFESWTALIREVERRTLEGQFRDAIDGGDLAKVQAIVAADPKAISLVMRWCDGGSPFVYAAQAGQMEIMRWLADRGPTDLQHALSRASMRYHPAAMAELMRMGADPTGPYSATYHDYAVISAVAEALNPKGLRALVDLGAPIFWKDSQGREQSIPALLLTIYSRDPQRKAECLDICESAGFEFPDTPAIRIFRRRMEGIDVNRHFTLDEIYPPELGCGEGVVATPVEGATPLHLAVEFDDDETASRLLAMGADPNARTKEPDGHTPLFHAAVTLGRRTDRMARLLVEGGADPRLRATITRKLSLTEEVEPSEERTFADVTAAEFGDQPWPSWPRNEAAVRYLRAL